MTNVFAKRRAAKAAMKAHLQKVVDQKMLQDWWDATSPIGEEIGVMPEDWDGGFR